MLKQESDECLKKKKYYLSYRLRLFILYMIDSVPRIQENSDILKRMLTCWIMFPIFMLQISVCLFLTKFKAFQKPKETSEVTNTVLLL